MTPETLDVRTFILSCVRQALAAIGMEHRELPEDFDLRASGVIDSLGFVQLLGHLETRFDRSIDLSCLPPEELTHLGVLSRHIAEQVAGADATLAALDSQPQLNHPA
jgi:acyl carrier protein